MFAQELALLLVGLVGEVGFLLGEQLEFVGQDGGFCLEQGQLLAEGFL